MIYGEEQNNKEYIYSKKHNSTKKYLIWFFLAIFIGIILSFFIFKFTASSSQYLGNIIKEEYQNYVLETKENEIEDEEIIIDNIIIQEENILKELDIEKEENVNDYINSKGKKLDIVKGLLMFRGNLSRTFYGDGILPYTPETKWKYPKERMCSPSSVKGKTTIWCGTGWTGQPIVYEKDSGEIEIIFGAYDGKVHFLNSKGEDTRQPFVTNDIIKGSVSLDPDGFPLIYFGSRDNKLRIVALDREMPTELWALDSVKLGGIWNNDWDGNPLIIDDILYEGGENGIFYAIKLNREIDDEGKVSVYPKIIFSMPSYNQKLIDEVGRNLSIENSLAFFDNKIYFANSGGRILGLDVSKIEEGIAPIIFDYWVGDDVDSTIVIDEEGMLYVSVELERFNERSNELGQFIKLNPYREDPFIWGIKVPKDDLEVGGIWATPALYKDYLYVPTHTGRFLGVNKNTGEIIWETGIAKHSWSSPSIVNDELIIGTCDGSLKKYSLINPENPKLMWTYGLGAGSCIESTPAIWDGDIYVGSRDGYFYKVGE